MNFLLFFTAYILLLPMTLINFIVVGSKGYFRDTALSIDVFANREYRASWNKFLRTEEGYPFGAPGETISSALGKNQRNGTLRPLGVKLVWVLDLFEENHCLKAINDSIVVA